MSLLGSIGSALTGLGKSIFSGVKSVAGPVLGGVVGTALGGPVGGAIGSTLGSSIGGGGVRLPTTITNPRRGQLPVIPGAGVGGGIGGGMGGLVTLGAAAGGGALAGEVVGHVMSDGRVVRKRRRRGKGITARDLRSFKRVARLVDKYSKPVHHFRNFKAKG